MSDCARCGQPTEITIVTDGGVILEAAHCALGHYRYTDLTPPSSLTTPRRFTRRLPPMPPPPCQHCRISNANGHGNCVKHGGMTNQERQSVRLRAWRRRRRVGRNA